MCSSFSCGQLSREQRAGSRGKYRRSEAEKAEKEDVAKIEEKIDAADEEERQAQEEWEGRPLSERFAHAVVPGDSITGGFLDYEVLDSSKVVSKTGVHLKDLEPYIQKTADLKPKVVFLALGLNDVTLTDGDTDTFIKTYRKVLRSVIEKLPDARIYINGILPVTKERAEKHAPYKKIDQYNEVLRKMCQEEEITFIDNAPLVKQEYYEPDGEHMKITFYPVWAEHMAEEAGL